MFRLVLPLLILAASALPAHAQGRGGGGPGGAGGPKEDEPKKERFTTTLKIWLDAESIEDKVKNALAKSKAVTNVEVDAETRLAKVTFAGEDLREALKLEELLAKAQVPGALYDQARYVFQLRSGRATTDEIRTLLKDCTGGLVEVLGPGAFGLWAGPVDLGKIEEAADKLKLKLECTSHAKLSFEVEALEGKTPDPTALAAKFDARRGILKVDRGDRKFDLLVLRAQVRLEDAKKIAKSADFAVKEEPRK